MIKSSKHAELIIYTKSIILDSYSLEIDEIQTRKSLLLKFKHTYWH